MVGEGLVGIDTFSALFLKLDYEKAFDRVDHSFLWGAFARIGLEEKFIFLV